MPKRKAQLSAVPSVSGQEHPDIRVWLLCQLCRQPITGHSRVLPHIVTSDNAAPVYMHVRCCRISSNGLFVR